MKNSIKILMGLALLAIGSQAQALVITPTTIDGVLCTDGVDCWSGSVPNNPDADSVMTETGASDLVSLYKANVGDPVVEEGAFSSSYETTFGADPLDPEDAFINYVSGPIISCPDCFLVVKDGNQDPIWYIFDLGSWAGDFIDILGFWPNQGAISHVEIYGNSAANVPEPGMVGLLAIGLIGVVVARRKMKV